MAMDLSMPVLVVDDYNTMIRIIRNLLKQLGFQNIDDASDGSAALNKMRSKKYGLVISDWNMEPMTGYDLLREVRGDHLGAPSLQLERRRQYAEMPVEVDRHVSLRKRFVAQGRCKGRATAENRHECRRDASAGR